MSMKDAFGILQHDAKLDEDAKAIAATLATCDDDTAAKRIQTIASDLIGSYPESFSDEQRKAGEELALTFCQRASALRDEIKSRSAGRR